MVNEAEGTKGTEEEVKADPMAFTPRDQIVFALGQLKIREELLTAANNALVADRAKLCEQLKGL